MNSSPATNKEVVRTYIERIVGLGELDLIDELARPDMVQWDLNGGTMTETRGWPDGTEGLRYHVAGFRASFPDLRTEVVSLTAEENRVAVVWRATGTHLGPFQGLDATGKVATSTVSSHFTFEDGKVSEYFWVHGLYSWLTAMEVPDAGRLSMGDAPTS